VLNNKVLVFIGKISYGIYLFHTIVPAAWRFMLNWSIERGFDIHSLYIFIPDKYYDHVDLVGKFILLILVAWLSWISVEQPINKLKKYFEYRPSVDKVHSVNAR
jgi:peptidoglycan/LPS O-acetylase OafA/YrhL